MSKIMHINRADVDGEETVNIKKSLYHQISNKAFDKYLTCIIDHYSVIGFELKKKEDVDCYWPYFNFRLTFEKKDV